MFKSIAYVIKENMTNLYRIFCIARYELLADMRDSKFGLFWNFASPAIQVITCLLYTSPERDVRGSHEDPEQAGHRNQ